MKPKREMGTGLGGEGKSARLLQPLFLLLIFLVLLVLTFGSALLNYRDHRREVLSLLEDEGLALARAAARAAESGPLGVRIIREIGEVEGLAFAVVEDSQGVMALSRKAWDTPFPLEDPFIDSLFVSGEPASRLITVLYPERGETEILEAVAPMTLEDGQRGIVRIGLETVHLAEARNRLRRTLVLRSALSLIIGLGLIAYLSVANSRRFLAQESRRLRGEILRIEEARQRDERLNAMGELARGVAHEIKNPLNTLRMLGQRLGREFSPREDGDEYQRLTGIMVAEVDRITRIVNDFLAYARPGKTDRRRADLNDKLRSIAEAFHLGAEAKRVKLQTELQGNLDLPFDADLIDQMILNLLINGLEALEAGGTLSLRSWRDGDEALIEIADDGPGIPEDRRANVWDLYYSTKETGTGMGLPTVHRIVAEHGGRIEMDSEIGRGTRFLIHLPMESA